MVYNPGQKKQHTPLKGMDIGILVVAVIALLVLIVALVLTALNYSRNNEGDANKLTAPVRGSIGRYMDKLYPQLSKHHKLWSTLSYDDLKYAYLHLDVYYTHIIPSLEPDIRAKLPRFTQLPNFSQTPGDWLRLFDGNVCDCLRFTFPTCQYNSSRFRDSDLEQNCPDWSGIRIAVPNSFVLMRAYQSNNLTGNTIKDGVTPVGSGKGFPNHAWFEGLAFPGEYGYPVACGAKLPPALSGNQTGLEYKTAEAPSWRPLNIPWSDSPWYGKECTSDADCPVAFLKCVNIKSDGQFPSEGVKPDGSGATGYCINNQYIKADPNSSSSSGGGGGGDKRSSRVHLGDGESVYDALLRNAQDMTRLQGVADCTDFPTTPCKSPPTTGFHGLWLYPLRGVGMWWNVGNSVVSNTKLGWMLAPKPQGIGYTLLELLPIMEFGAPNTNINDQVQLVANVIQYGQSNFVMKNGKKKYYRLADVDACSVEELQRNGYTGAQMVDNPTGAYDAALTLVTTWYVDGHSGLDSAEAPNGFNYSYQHFFPVGTYFSYAAALDVLTSGLMIARELDTLQLVVEPQNALGGLRPAYFFETFSQTPSKPSKWSAYKTGPANVCNNFYMVDPRVDWENFSKYGYVNDAAVGTNGRSNFDAELMPYNAASPSFQP